MTGGVFYEHGHRVVAGTLSLLVLGLSGWGRRGRAAASWAALAHLGSPSSPC